MFLKGLREGGVPIKFSSWHTFVFTNASAQTLNVLIQERSRSVKSIFTVIRRTPDDFESDSGALQFAQSTVSGQDLTSTLLNYQYRIGGRYFPASPVQTGYGSGTGAVCNGGAEAYLELQKALNTVGDYRLKTSANVLRWAIMPRQVAFGVGNTVNIGETDYHAYITGWNSGGDPITTPTIPVSTIGQYAFCGNVGSSCFAMATNLETSNGEEISGLNAEEQSDISLTAVYSGPQVGAFTGVNYNVEVYTYFDAMLILRENNVLELIQ